MNMIVPVISGLLHCTDVIRIVSLLSVSPWPFLLETEKSVSGPALLTYIICWYNSARSCLNAVFTGTSSSGLPRRTLGCSCSDFVSHIYCGLELVSPHPVEDPGQQATQTWGISAPVRQMEIPLEHIKGYISAIYISGMERKPSLQAKQHNVWNV